MYRYSGLNLFLPVLAGNRNVVHASYRADVVPIISALDVLQRTVSVLRTPAKPPMIPFPINADGQGYFHEILFPLGMSTSEKVGNWHLIQNQR